MTTLQPTAKDVMITNYQRKRSWGWAFSNQPTGQGTAIEMPTSQMHTGTLGAVSRAIANDAAYQPRSGTFYATAWFWRKSRITHTWAWIVLRSAPDLPFDPTTTTYAEWTRANIEHHQRTNVWGWGWTPGFHPPHDHPDIKIRVA